MDKLIADNRFETLKKQLDELLYGTAHFEKALEYLPKIHEGHAFYRLLKM